MVPLLLALLAQTPVDLPAASREPLTGTQPAVAYVGLQQYAVTWVDDRFDFLHRRRPTPSGATDLWYSRLSTDGGVRVPQRLCPAAPLGRPALLAAAGALTAFWHEEVSPGQVGVRRARVNPDGGVDCPPPLFVSSDAANELTVAWSGTRAFLAWTTNDSNSRLCGAWLDGAGTVTSGPNEYLSGLAAYASLSTGATTGTVRMSYLDSASAAHRTQVVESDTGVMNFETLKSGATQTAMDPAAGGFTVVQSSGGTEAHFVGGPVVNLLSTGTGQLRVVTAAATGRSLAMDEGPSGLSIVGFSAGGRTQNVVLNNEMEAAAASDGTGVLLVSNDARQELHSARLSLGPTTLTVSSLPGSFFSSDAPQRRPSAAFFMDRFVIAYEERTDAGFVTRLVGLQKDNGLTTSVPAPTLRDASLFNRPDGTALVRHDVGLTTQTAVAVFDLATNVPSPGPPLLSSAPAGAGAATDRRAVHWSDTTLFVEGASARPFANMVPSRTGATTASDLWLPVLSAGKLMTLYLTEAELASSSSLPQPRVQHASSFDRDVSPGIAVLSTPMGPRALIAWADANQDRVHWEVFDSNGTYEQGAEDALPPVRGIAVAASTGGWVMTFSDARGLNTRAYSLDGSLGFGTVFGTPPEVAGEPVMAAAPDGTVVSVWPVFSPSRATVGLRAVVLDPFPGTTDGGVGVDGGLDAGAPTDGGVRPDAGARTDGGVAPDGGDTPDGGLGPAVFETSGCGCTSAADASAWLLAGLALCACWARHRRR
ncbi:MAG: hypothetical protein IT380_13165 [Myxococcales bacterium]|nr:hypothetical protein [Myxococcales bacterium]